MKEVHLQFCCLISSSINYKRMQPGLLKSLKGLLLGPPSLFPRKVISFHTPRSIWQRAGRLCVCWTTPLLSMFFHALHTSFVKAAVTGVFGKDPTDQHILYKHNAERNTACMHDLYVILNVFHHFIGHLFPRVEYL